MMNFKQLSEITPRFEVETRISENTVALVWKKVPHADGYRVFSCKHGTSDFRGCENTADTKMTLKDLKNGVPLDFKVKAFRNADGPDNFFGESVIVTACPLESPKNLTASINDGGIMLSWSEAADCDGYKIYMDSAKGDKFNFLRYCGDCACKLDTIPRSGGITFRVRSFKIINHVEKISNYSNAAVVTAVKPKAKQSGKKPPHEPYAQSGRLTVTPRFAKKNDELRNENGKCVIMIGGDISTNRGIQAEAAAAGGSYDFAFSFVSDIFSSSDFSVAVLDTDMNDKKHYTCEDDTTLNCPSSLADAMMKSGIDALALNSALLKKPPESLKSSPVPFISPSENTVGGEKFKICRVNGIKIGFISTLCDSDVTKDISSARAAGAEYIIVFCSWKERHTPVVKESQRAAAQRIADCGADFIVGCGLGTLCEYDILKSGEREVPCAYSIGSLINGKVQTAFENYSVILCLRLKRDAATGRVRNVSTGYLPCVMKSSGLAKCAVLLDEKNRRSFGSGDFARYGKRISEILGGKISPARGKAAKHRSFMLSGSGFLRRMFAKCENVSFDRTHLHISQFTVCGKTRDIDEKYFDNSTALYYNLIKGYDNYLRNNKKDYLVLDLYYAATVPYYKMGDTVYSGGSSFVGSKFFADNKDKLVPVDLKADGMWKAYLDEYIDTVLSVYGHDIILISITDPELYRINDVFVKRSDESLDKKLLLEMESYFVKRVNPIVISISRYYCGEMNKRGVCYAINRDPRFTENLFSAVMAAVSRDPSLQGCRYSCDNRLWLESIAEYFDAIKSCGCSQFFFSPGNAADEIIAGTGADFIYSNFSSILELKESGFISYAEILGSYDFKGNNSLKKVCRAIYCIKRGELTDPSINEVIRLGLYARKDLAAKLSDYFDTTGLIPACRLGTEHLDFYLKCAVMYIGGTGKSAVKQLVSSFYEKNRPPVVDIWGGSNLSGILALSQTSFKGAVISDSTVLTAFEKPVKADLSYTESGSSFWNELSRNHKNKLGKHSDWILVDFNEIIRPLYAHGGTYFGQISGCENTRLFKTFCADDRKILPYDSENGIGDAHLKRAIKAFAAFLKEKYGEHIILSRFSLCRCSLDEDMCLKPFSDTSIDDKNRLIEKAESLFIAAANCYVLEYSDKFISHITGARTRAISSQYEKLFYVNSAAALDRILSGSTEKHQSKVDMLSYIERAEKIKKANPSLTDEDCAALFGGMAKLMR